jgi:excisionase family DNA binding protein
MAIRTSSGEDNLDALDIPAVCRRSGTGRSFVYEEIRAGRLIARKFGRLTRVLRADYQAWLAAAPPILAVLPSTRAGPNPAPEFRSASVPANIGDDRETKPPGAANRPRVGRNGGRSLNPTNGNRRRFIGSGAYR